MKGDKFKPGDRVFAKVKGYPFWPAHIDKRLPGSVETYELHFYGTYEEGKIKAEMILPYTRTNVTKFDVKKNPKFKEAMSEIADNIDIAAKIAGAKSSRVTTVAKEVASTKAPSSGGTLKASATKVKSIGGAPKASAKVIPLASKAPSTRGTLKASAAKVKSTGGAPKASAKVIPLASKAPSTRGTLKASAAKVKSTGEDPNSKAPSSGGASNASQKIPTAPQPEMTTRSGRRIQQKRFADDEGVVKVVAKKPKVSSSSESNGSTTSEVSAEITPDSEPPTHPVEVHLTPPSIVEAVESPRNEIPSSNGREIMLEQGKDNYLISEELQDMPLTSLFITGFAFGSVSFPINERVAAFLKPRLSHSNLNSNGKRVVDTAGRTSYELKAEEFKVENERWDAYFNRVVLPKVAAGLNVDYCKMRAVLVKFLLNDKDSDFEKYIDEIKKRGSFGTLVIQLPSKYSGGQFTTLDGSRVVDNSSFTGSTNQFSTFLTAFSTGVEHRIREVTEGFQSCLVYDLIDIGVSKAVGNTRKRPRMEAAP